MPPVPPAESLEFGPPAARAGRGRALIGGVALVAAALLVGCPALNSPWLVGDEYIFIVDNPDVNPAAGPLPAPPLLDRVARLFASVQEDLYQPIPLATYALEWAFRGPDAAGFRRTDLVLHAGNALMVWLVLATLLRPAGRRHDAAASVAAWAGALLWAVHPALVTAYAADMGRTHLLCALFSLTALWLYVRALEHHPAWFAGALAALTLAMLCKPVPGWVLPAVALEVARHGPRQAARSPRPYIVAVLCAGFAVLTVFTTRASGILEDASRGLFGDPVARSGLALWMYLRSVLVPVWLSFWYLPDPATHWGNPRIWGGLGFAALSVLHAFRAARREDAATLVGWAWFWGLLLPVLGFIGAREAAATDRYLYQPLVGLVLVAAAALVPRLTRVAPPRRLLGVGATVAVLALALMLIASAQVRVARSPLLRAERLVELYPGDPRALEALAVAYDFARNHPLVPADAARVPTGESQLIYFNDRLCDALERAARVPDLAAYFPGPEDRAPFHRRLSYRALMAGLRDLALAQANAAVSLQPERYASWKRLAHALQALRRLDEAAAAYAAAEARLPDNPQTQAAHYTDFGLLLMFELERDDEACPRFARAVELGCAPRPAEIGLALCMIRDRRYGTGADGLHVLQRILAQEPGNWQAGLALAEYHLRSHNWVDAARIYAALLRDHPVLYPALRGFQEACLQTRRYREAAVAWQDALLRLPESREFESFFVWCVALAGEPNAPDAADALLNRDPTNPLACFARALLAVRRNDLAAAVDWAAKARGGPPLSHAREYARAAAALRLLVERGELPRAAVLVEAQVVADGAFGPAERADVAARLRAWSASDGAQVLDDTVHGLLRRLAEEGVTPGAHDSGEESRADG